MTSRFASSLLILIYLVACGTRSPIGDAASTATPIPVPTRAPTAGPQPTEGPSNLSGNFNLKNSSPDLPEVLVEKMEMVIEFQKEQTGAWQGVESQCAFVPGVPLIVRENQTVRYDCKLQAALPEGADLRATVEIRLMGSDEIFRLQVQK